MVSRPNNGPNTGSTDSSIFSMRTVSPTPRAFSITSRYLQQINQVKLMNHVNENWYRVSYMFAFFGEFQPYIIWGYTFYYRKLKKRRYLWQKVVVKKKKRVGDWIIDGFKKCKTKMLKNDFVGLVDLLKKIQFDTYPLCPIRITFKSAPYFFLIHLIPCSCGSIISGQRWQLL